MSSSSEGLNLEWKGRDWVACSIHELGHVRELADLTMRLKLQFTIAADSTCYNGRKLDYLVVSSGYERCVQNLCSDPTARWTTHVALRSEIIRRLCQITSRQLVTTTAASPAPTGL